MKAFFTLIAGMLSSLALADDSVVELFDGKTLAGWETAEGHRVTQGWRVENGTIFRHARSGPIYAVGEYSDFKLNVQWKIAPGGNSGVKYRMAFYSKGIWGNPAWLGCEYQIFDDKARPHDPRQSAGALYGLYTPNDKKKLKPVGEFNESQIVCDGSKIEHWLNGQLILKVDTSSDDWKQRVAASKFGKAEHFFENPRGRIQLQDHGHNVWFRNITLRKLNGSKLNGK